MVRIHRRHTVTAPPPSHSSAPGRDLLVAGGCWLAVSIVLLTLPLLTGGTSLPGPTQPGSPGWWACAATFTVQAVALVWARRFPRATVVAVAALPLPLATLAIGDVFSLS